MALANGRRRLVRELTQRVYPSTRYARWSQARVITSAGIVTQSLFPALWVFFGITALVLCGLIFLIARSSTRKDRR